MTPFQEKLARAWEEGHLAGDRDCAVARVVEAGISVNVTFPTPNPYRVQTTASCADHRPSQHRDRRRPWCNTCGRAADGELIGTPQDLTVSSCPHPADMRLPRDMCGICHEKLPKTGLRRYADDLQVAYETGPESCRHPSELRSVISGRLTCGRCGLVLSDG